jgi:SPP1 gp7 family putative phage head morphogenesis protein
LTGNEIAAAGDLIALGEAHARELIALGMGRGAQIAGMFNVLPREAIQTLLGFLDPNGPLFDRLRQLATVNAQYVANAMIEGITLGYNPRKIARMVRDAFGRGLADALRFVRTAQIWAYREANRASMVANQNVLEGWVWSAHFDDRVCMSCVVMHGTIHPVDEALNDHHNGRCAAIPLVRGFDNPIDQTGLEWFEQQSEATQRALMGSGKYDAWKSGKIELGQLTVERVDDVYGAMRGEPSLKQLLGTMEAITQ